MSVYEPAHPTRFYAEAGRIQASYESHDYANNNPNHLERNIYSEIFQEIKPMSYGNN